MRMLVVLSVFCFGISAAEAQYNRDANAELAAARTAVKEIRTKDVVTAAKPLNNKIDYIAGRYDAGELRALIKNYEKTNKKLRPDKARLIFLTTAKLTLTIRKRSNVISATA